MALMGLDVGTSGCKATVFAEDGSPAGQAWQEYPPLVCEPGTAEIDPEAVWQAVRQVIRQAADKSRESVAALSISSFGESAVPVDRNGRVLHRSLLYTDPRGQAQCDRLVGRLGMDRIMRTTGVRAHPMYTLAKILWFRDEQPDLFRQVWKFLLFGDFILYRLCGETAIDPSLAARTMASSVLEQDWDDDLLQAAGLDRRLFSRIVPSGTAVGTLRPELAADLHLPGSVRLVTGGHDQVCAAVGAGISRPGLAVAGMGTVDCVTPAFDRPLLTRAMLDRHYACVPHAIPGLYVTYAFNFSSGSLLQWYRDRFAARECAEAEARGLSVYRLLDEAAARTGSLAVIDDSLLVLPHFAGAGTPYMNPSAQSAILGLTLQTPASRLYLGLLEGVAFEMRCNLDALSAAGVRIDEIRAVGGGARSPLWLQIRADVTGRRITTLDLAEAGTIGAAVLAGTATGIFSSVNEGYGRLVRPGRTYEPDLRRQAIYDRKYERYRRLYDLLQTL